jgi:hypothetical protein
VDAQSVGVLLIGFDEALGKIADGDAHLAGAIDHFVVNVGEILNVSDAVTAMFQVAPQDVKDDEGSGVADVKEVVDRRAADVKRDLALPERDEGLFPSRQIVVKAQSHGTKSPFSR